jgi:uncharacterized protein YjiS (DUF1127 family)
MSAERSCSPARGGMAVAALFLAFSGARRLMDLATVWVARRRQRQRLHEMSDHMLRDIGASRADTEHEAGKPFWRS